jgi:1,4-alpha-glucan branching enzyme
MRTLYSLAIASASAGLCCSLSWSQVSQRPGFGAVPYTQGSQFGVTFRVFAPNASSVNVAGSFNFWNSTSMPLYSEGNGYWSVDAPNIQAGSQYKFVIRNGTQTLWKNDPWARDLTNSVGNSVIYNPASYVWQSNSYQAPTWDRIVMYEMHVGTYGTSASGNPPANFDQCTARLDHLQELGVNMIVLMPTTEFAGDVSWGYNGSFPYSVEAAYGSPNDMKEFIDAAHARGLGVNVDVVYNHLGPSDLDMWRFDGWFQNVNGVEGGGIFFYNDERVVTPWGNTRPDFGRGEVRTYLRNNALMWLEEFRVDGLRLDGTKFIRRIGLTGPDNPQGWSLLQWINNDIDAVSPGKLIVAEDMDVDSWITKTTGEGGAGFDSQWDSSFYPRVRGNLISSSDASRDMWAIRDAVAFSYNGSMQQRVIYTESHDEVANGRSRVPEEISPGDAGSYWARKRSTLGGVLVMTAPGIPMIFQGQEFLEDEYFRDNVPLDWSRKTTFAGIFLLYKDLIKLRKNVGGTTRGLSGFSTNVFHVNNTDKVLAYHRWQNGGQYDDTIVVMNFSVTAKNNYRIGLPRSGTWHCRFNSDWTGYSSDFGNTLCLSTSTSPVAWDGLAQSALVNIGPYSAVILSQGATFLPEDINLDGFVNATDLAILLAAWGTSGGPSDIDGDGTVAGADMARLLAAWQ